MKLLSGLTILAIIIDVLWLNPVTAALATIATITLMIYATGKLLKGMK